jgi:hypothetical protein
MTLLNHVSLLNSSQAKKKYEHKPARNRNIVKVQIFRDAQTAALKMVKRVYVTMKRRRRPRTSDIYIPNRV